MSEVLAAPEGFNPRLRTGGDPGDPEDRRPPHGCFNPRLRTGGDGRAPREVADLVIVSIRASAREATFVSVSPGGALQLVSIRASAREATARARGESAGTGCFNPRLRTGGDSRLPAGFRLPLVVSIRASAREATSLPPAGAPTKSGFNPRLRTGGDSIDPVNHKACPCFNPRLRTGGDATLRFHGTTPRQFQSAPPHGRRPRICCASSIQYRFNPRLRTGGDSRPSCSHAASTAFQSAPPHGRRHSGEVDLQRLAMVSIRASAREATDGASGAPRRRQGFNPRLRTGGDE